ncbi:MAG: 50S ribosomal protein L9 [Acidobacteriales bacterium]|nr:50S ribosomal protein L9 [Terriglobales bacterium]
MEVILREDIEKLGSRGQVVKVADGYARNYLLPRRLAVVATEANKKIVEQERQAYLRREAKVLADAQELAKIMAPVSVTIKQKAGEQDQLFGSVTSKDIAEALEKAGYSVERRKIQLEAPIKQVGEFKVPVRLHRDVTVDITVTVARDEEAAATAEAEAPKEEQK